MEIKKKYILLKDLDVYQLARELSKIAWEIYQDLSWQDKKIIGNQFIESADSTGANIAEGYGRFHFLEKIKFFYNARASLTEATEHWLELLKERKKIESGNYKKFREIAERLSIKLNNFIQSTYKSKTINFNKFQ
ncbi:MAG: four helix bundle protein [Patescibacteria group bacterium]|nr:four helix bundle protein [Patescibacteria group bacterium]